MDNTNSAKERLLRSNRKHMKEIVDIPRMMDMALEMLSDSLTAFYTEDVTLARKCDFSRDRQKV